MAGLDLRKDCPTEYKEQEKTKSKKTSRYQVLNADNATNV